MKPYDFKWTKFYDTNAGFNDLYPNISIDLFEEELIICSTIIDLANYSILTTQRLITNENSILISGRIMGSVDKSYGDFKGYEDSLHTFGRIQLPNGAILRYFIETGKASMVMIHGVRTINRINSMTNIQVEKVAGIWKRQNDK
ncbi:hypothetical protein F0919_00045 [Taibaiella lutea]|uniref:Uncharacterized protein n=1 Tax=Taibaiella lutea TaxID=2608001 RepID=A0A5M6CSI1_9BACT|nr:hypothetical protein [Taibaiella lutea]KAA5536099.1 hypothetical protein F0919_00045 [Taibaiella lutea]